MSVQLVQFYPHKEVITPTELYYISQLGKHLKHYYNEQLDLSGVKIKEEVLNSDMGNSLKFAIKCGDIVNFEGTFEDNGVYIPKSSWENILITEEIFDTYSPETVIDPLELGEPRLVSVRLDWDLANNSVIFKHRCDTYDAGTINGRITVNNNLRFISLIAYVAVKRVKEYSDLKLEIMGNDTNYGFLIHPKILQERSSAINEWVTLNIDSISKENIRNVNSKAWYKIGENLGYFNSKKYPDGIPTEEKLAWIKKLDLQVGDVVEVLYRKESQKNLTTKPIDGVTFAIIKDIEENIEYADSGIAYDEIGTIQTKYMYQKKYDELPVADKSTYASSYNPTRGKLLFNKEEWGDIGIDYCTNLELKVITPIQKGTSIVLTDVSKVTGKEIRIELDVAEYIYWICKEYGYKFNEERYKERYLPFTVPMYDRFIAGEF